MVFHRKSIQQRDSRSGVKGDIGAWQNIHLVLGGDASCGGAHNRFNMPKIIVHK